MLSLPRRALLVAAALAPLAGARQDGERPREPRFVEGAERRAFLERLESTLARRESVAATFVQEKVLTLFEETVVTRGVLLFARPDALRWEVTEPFRSLLVVAGDDVAKFEWVDGERRRLELGRAKEPLLLVMGQIRSWFRGRFESRQYSLRVATEPVPLVVLEPVDASLAKSLTAIEVRLAPELDAVRSVVVRERSGDHTTMTFEERARDVPLDAAYFSVRDPRPFVPEELLPPEQTR